MILQIKTKKHTERASQDLMEFFIGIIIVNQIRKVHEDVKMCLES